MAVAWALDRPHRPGLGVKAAPAEFVDPATGELRSAPWSSPDAAPASSLPAAPAPVVSPYTEPTRRLVEKYGVDLIKQVGFARPLSGGWIGDFTGSAALHQALVSNPCAVIINDEPEVQFKRIYSPTASASMAELAKHLRTLTTDVDDELLARRYAGGATLASVSHPHVCMAIVGTNASFWENLPSACHSDGTLGRYAIMEEDGMADESVAIDLFDDNEAEEIERLISSLAAWVADVLRVRCPDPMEDPTFGGLVSPTVGTSAPMLVPVRFAPDAKRLQNAFATSHRQAFLSATKAKRNDAALWQRSNELAMKLSLVLALTRDVREPVISSADVEFAGWLMLHNTARVGARVTSPEGSDLDPKFVAACETVLGRIRQATAAAGYLAHGRAVHKLPAARGAQVVDALLCDGSIRREVVSGAVRYIATGV